MAPIIAISNQKGGVGKTTTVVNLASFCALGGLRTLVVDSDPQGNASSVLATVTATTSIYSGGTAQATAQDGLWIVPAAPDLIEHEQERTGTGGSGRFALRDLLLPLRETYDLILIDCPPNLSLLPTRALLAADHLLIPLQCEYFALEGLSQLLRYVDDLREDVNATISLLGILLTMHDPKHPLARQVVAEVRQHFSERVFTSIIPRDIALAAAPSHGKSILAYDPLSAGGIAYLAAAQELIHGIKRQ